MKKNFDLSKVIINEITTNEIVMFTHYRLEYLSEMQVVSDPGFIDKLKADLLNFFITEFKENRIFAFVAKYENEILGFGAMIIKRIPGDMKKSIYSEGEILNMYTLKHTRRKGISSLILAKLIEEAKNRGISKVSLHTSTDGEMLYRKFGFSEPEYPFLERIIN